MYFGHTLNLLLTFGLGVEIIVTLPQSETISDHYLIIHFVIHWTVAPPKRKISIEKKIAPWYNEDTHTLKQTARKLDRKWYQHEKRVSRAIRRLS